MRTFFSLIGAGLVFAALSGAVLSWDGSVYLFNVLNEQQPFAANDRFINVLLHWPVVLGSRLTSNIVVLQTLLGLMYVTIPLTALALCWWVVRDGARELFIWPALAIGLGMLPGIFQFVAEANIVVFLFWPVVLAIVLGMQRRAVPVVIVLLVLIALSHPSAVLLFAFAAALAVVVGVQQRADRRRLWLWAGGFAAAAFAALLRLTIGGTAYEREQLSLGIYAWSFGVAVWGLPLLALVSAAVGAGCIVAAPLLARRNNARGSALAQHLVLASIVVAGAVLVLWARDPTQWKWANKFTMWAPFVSLVFMSLAALDRFVGRADVQHHERWTERRRLLPVIAGTFFVVLAVQSAAWIGVLQRFDSTVAESAWACVSMAPIDWLDDTPLNQFGTPALSLVRQGKTPQKLVVPGDECGTQAFGQGYRWDAQTLRPWQSAWFDLQQLNNALVGEQTFSSDCSFALTTGWHQTETNGPYWWRWSDGRAPIMRVLLAQEGTVALRGQIESREQPNTITVLVNGQPQTTVDVAAQGLRTLDAVPLTLQQGTNTVQFVSQNPPIETDGRLLAIDVSNVSIVAGEQNMACRFHP